MGRKTEAADRSIKDIRRQTRKRYSAEEKIRIVLAGLRAQTSKAIGQYVEGFYNPRRRHSSLGYVRPAAFEMAYRVNNQKEQLALH